MHIDRFEMREPPPDPAPDSLSGFRVLVVDDEESIRFGLSRLLAQRGAQTEAAPSIGAAVALLEKFRPDAILLDLKLPDAEELSGLRRLREARPDARVVVMTGFGTIENAVEAVKMGAEDFLTKPVSTGHLFHVLGRIADAQRLERENRALKREIDRSAPSSSGASRRRSPPSCRKPRGSRVRTRWSS